MATIGKYRLIAELGQGGMADVFLAVASGPAGLGFSKLVVIKRLREHLANDPDFVAMLVDEARIAARLNHPNVVQTIEIGEADGQYFLAMEYLEGQPLRSILRRFPAGEAELPQRLRYLVLQRTLAGLHHAHELTDYNRTPLNIVHRDVSPHNIFVTYDGQVKVVDFGVAKAVGRMSETRTGMIKGKVAYMSPEQAVGQPVDRRADIFSVGVMMWEIAVGKRMWAGVKSDNAILTRLARAEMPGSPRTVQPDVPLEIDAICRRATAVDPDSRYATAAEFEAVIAEYLRSQGPAPTDQELGDAIARGFAEARENARGIIDRQLHQVSMASPSSASLEMPALPHGDSGPSASLPTGSLPSTSISASVKLEGLPRPQDPSGETLAAPSGVSQPRTSPREKPRHLTGAVGMLGLVVAIVIGARTLGRSSNGEVSPGATSTTVQAPARSSSSPAPSSLRAQEVTIHLTASPAEATFLLDDGQGFTNPVEIRRARDSVAHTIRVSAPGCTTLTKAFTFDDDVAMRLSLACGQDAVGTPPAASGQPSGRILQQSPRR